MQASTACRIFNKAKDDAGNDNFHDLLATFSPKSARPGRDPLVQNGSKASAGIREDILTFPRYAMEDASVGAVNAAGLRPLARSMIEKIAHEHRDSKHDYEIVRGVRPKKPFLTPADNESRYIHYTWPEDIIKQWNGQVIFICSDETYKAFGGGSCQKLKQSRSKGRMQTRLRLLIFLLNLPL